MAVTSNPWAQVPATLPPMSSMAAQPQAPAPVFASIPDTSGPAPDLTQAMPEKATFDAHGHRIDQDQARLEKIRWQEQNPWGTPDNHPGLGGKVAHVFSRIGNIAGDIVAPNVMARIPGTELNREVQEQGLTNRIEREEQEQSQNQERGALTAKTQEETAEAPGKAKSEEALQEAQTENLNAEAGSHNKPDLAQAYAHAVTSAIQGGRDPQTDPVVQHIADAITSIQKQPAQKEATKTVPLEIGGRPHQVLIDEATGKTIKDLGESGEKPPVTNLNLGREEKNDILKAYQPSLDSAERMNVMTDAYEKAVKNHDQQAMLNLLANHLGMTMGLQKGARMTKDIIHEAQQSQPWLQGMESKFDKDGYLSGVTLSPQQMRQMVNLGQERYAEDAQKSRNTAQYLGAKDDGPQRTPGKATINYYLGLANGDPQKAKQLAAQDGWSVK